MSDVVKLIDLEVPGTTVAEELGGIIFANIALLFPTGNGISFIPAKRKTQESRFYVRCISFAILNVDAYLLCPVLCGLAASNLPALT